MLWIDSVRSLKYQIANTTASRIAKTVELSANGTLWPSVRLSVSSVPTTLINTTASQYTAGTYLRMRNCTTNVTTSAAEKTQVVFANPNPSVSLM